MNFGNFSNCAKCKNSILHLVIGGVVGAAIGSLTSYILTNRYWKKSIEIEDEWGFDYYEDENDIPEEYKNNISEEYENYLSIINKALGDSTDVNPMPEDDNSIEANEKAKEEIFAEMKNHYKNEIEENSYIPTESSQELIHTEIKETFEKIHSYDFGSIPSYKTETIYYYSKDNIFAEDENDEIIDYVINDLIGNELCRDVINLAKQYNENRACFVRNNEKEIDYEIIILNTSYAEDILGLDEDYTEEEFLQKLKERE